MKILLMLTLALMLSGWSLKPDTDEFGTRTGKTGSVGSSPVFGKTSKGAFSAGLAFTQHLAVIAVFNSSIGPYFYGTTKVAFRHSRGTVRFTAMGAGKGTLYLTGADARKVLSMAKKYRQLKIAVVDDDATYVFSVDCRGFTKVWNRARW